MMRRLNIGPPQLRQEVRRLPPPHANSRRARHAAPSCGLLRLRLRPTTTTTPVLRPALSPPPPPLRFLILHGPGHLKLREGRGRRARGSMQPLRTVYHNDNNFLPACARGARQATASSDGTAAGRRGVPLALAPWHPPLAGWCKVSGTEDRGPLEPDGPAIDDRIDRERDS